LFLALKPSHLDYLEIILQKSSPTYPSLQNIPILDPPHNLQEIKLLQTAPKKTPIKVQEGP